MEPLKDNEYLLCESRLDADPVVFDGDDPVAVLVTGAQTHDGRGVGVELDGVGDEVLEQRNEKGPIPVDGWQLSVGLDVCSCFGDPLGQVPLGEFQAGLKRDGLEVLGGAANSGEDQEVSDQDLHSLGAVHGEPDVLIGPLVELSRVALLQELTEAGHLPKRLLQVV